MDFKLEVVVIPVADVDRAVAFYNGLGWRQDADFATSESFRVVQFTPPGSPTSIIFGTGLTTQQPGTAQGLQLIVDDIEAARAELTDRGAEPSEVFHDAGGVFHHAGTQDRVTGPASEHSSYGSFLSFSDPDGNEWFLQEITTRLPGRIDSGITSFASVDDLTSALKRVAAAHGEHEARTGQEDPNWPDWYATWLVAEQSGAELPQ
ncbi:glyoxalase [Planctomonas sp. JC2975]|uniref:VOC family protein n=1 Tax=Planctomonas sp. JC2975 TaxID=2729626 RepID=UPI0017FCC9E2|nr:glyoxalase [Planctomonas sp. JC2975]